MQVNDNQSRVLLARLENQKRRAEDNANFERAVAIGQLARLKAPELFFALLKLRDDGDAKMADAVLAEFRGLL